MYECAHQMFLFSLFASQIGSLVNLKRIFKVFITGISHKMRFKLLSSLIKLFIMKVIATGIQFS